MFIQIGRKRPATPEAPQERRPPLEIIFRDEEYIDDANTFMRLPFVPRKGEEIQLDGDFRRRGCFIVEHVAYSLVCNGRRNGWVREDLLEVYINVFVREKEAEEESQASGAPAQAHRLD